MRKVPDLTEKEKVDVNAHIAECDSMLAKQASAAVPPCKTPRRTRFLPLRLHPAQAPAIRTLVLPIPLWCLSWRLRRCRPHPRAEGCGSRESPPQRSGFAQSLEPIFENGGSAILMSAATFSPSCSISLHLPCKAAALSAAEIPRYRGIISSEAEVFRGSRCYPTSRFVVLDGGFAHHTLTNLVWQQEASGTTMSWADAQTYCSSVSEGSKRRLW
jgi:hypothetical protein